MTVVSRTPLQKTSTKHCRAGASPAGLLSVPSRLDDQAMARQPERLPYKLPDLCYGRTGHLSRSNVREANDRSMGSRRKSILETLLSPNVLFDRSPFPSRNKPITSPDVLTNRAGPETQWPDPRGFAVTFAVIRQPKRNMKTSLSKKIVSLTVAATFVRHLSPHFWTDGPPPTKGCGKILRNALWIQPQAPVVPRAYRRCD